MPQKPQLTPAERLEKFTKAKSLIRKWTNVYFGAKPHRDALLSLSEPDQPYIVESGKSIAIYFLGNAQTWRGPEAKEAKQLLKDVYNVK